VTRPPPLADRRQEMHRDYVCALSPYHFCLRVSVGVRNLFSVHLSSAGRLLAHSTDGRIRCRKFVNVDCIGIDYGGCVRGRRRV
jgi:hypothetical protein